MRRAGHSVIVLICAFLTVVGQQNSQPIELNSTSWKQVSPPDSGFTVSMPGTPVSEKQLMDTKLGKIDNHLFSVQTSAAYYMVSYAEFPDVVNDPAIVKRILDGGRNQVLAASGAKLKNEKDMRLLQYLGREWAIEMPGNYVGTARAFWVKRRLYQAIMIARRADNESPEVIKVREHGALRFLDSFALSEQPIVK